MNSNKTVCAVHLLKNLKPWGTCPRLKPVVSPAGLPAGSLPSHGASVVSPGQGLSQGKNREGNREAGIVPSGNCNLTFPFPLPGHL